MVSGNARIAGVIGWPVTHSLSPRLHNHWLSQLGIDGAYIPLPVAPEHVRAAVRALPHLGFRGVNVTVPHKEAVMEWLDAVDDTARAIGAVNTIIIKEGKLTGTNTDAYGFVENLRASIGDLRPYLPHALMLGAGGAARAVIYALIQAGVKEITLINRTVSRAEALAEHFAPFPIHAYALEDNACKAAAEAGASMVVNTTSIGMDGRSELPSNLRHVSPKALVVDIAYKPLLTPFLQQAQARGLNTVDGIGMLIHQAVPGFRAWFGAEPPVTSALKGFLLS